MDLLVDCFDYVVGFSQPIRIGRRRYTSETPSRTTTHLSATVMKGYSTLMADLICNLLRQRLLMKTGTHSFRWINLPAASFIFIFGCMHHFNHLRVESAYHSTSMSSYSFTCMQIRNPDLRPAHPSTRSVSLTTASPSSFKVTASLGTVWPLPWSNSSAVSSSHMLNSANAPWMYGS